MERVNAPGTTSYLRQGLVTGAAVCGLLLTGCASSAQLSGVKLTAAEGSVALGSSATGASLSASMAEKLERIQHAQTVTRLGCIADNGYPDVATLIPTTLTPVNDQNNVSAEDAFFATAEDAAARGFGHSVPASPAKLVPHDPAFDAITDTCDQQAWQALGDNAQETVLEYHQLHSRLLAAPMNAISALTPDWTAKIAKCLADQGHPVTTGGGTWGMDFGIKLGGLERPDEERPVPSRTNGLEFIPGTPANPYIPTAEESVLASALYECSQTTGVRGEFEKLSLTARQKAETDNATAIEALTHKIQAIDDKAGSLASL
jgi:hypothetical protein